MVIDNPQLALTGCIPEDIPTWSWVYWLPSVGFDSILLLCALWKTLRGSQDTILRARAPLLVILLRDSFLYFAGIMLVTLSNLLAWYIKPVSATYHTFAPNADWVHIGTVLWIIHRVRLMIQDNFDVA